MIFSLVAGSQIEILCHKVGLAAGRSISKYNIKRPQAVEMERRQQATECV
jgi:hypothetical protein